MFTSADVEAPLGAPGVGWAGLGGLWRKPRCRGCFPALLREAQGAAQACCCYVSLGSTERHGHLTPPEAPSQKSSTAMQSPCSSPAAGVGMRPDTARPPGCWLPRHRSEQTWLKPTPRARGSSVTCLCPQLLLWNVCLCLGVIKSSLFLLILGVCACAHAHMTGGTVSAALGCICGCQCMSLLYRYHMKAHGTGLRLFLQWPEPWPSCFLA